MALLETRKIIWAVDAFADRIALQRAAAWAIYELTREKAAIEIQPVYMVGHWPDSIVPQRLMRSYLEKMGAFAQDSIGRMTRGIPLKNLKPIQILSGPFDSVKEGARNLAKHAELEGTDLLVASTRANRGHGGLMTLPGSFVEALVETSEIPVLSVNPRWRYATGIPSILFPSDLSHESHGWYLKTLDFAKMMKSGVTLFHKITLPLSQPYESAVRVFPDLRRMVHDKLKDSHAEAKRWAEEGRKRHVRVSVAIDSDMSGSLSGAVMSQLAVRPGSVIFAPPVSVTFPGGVIRKLMTHCPYPVLFLPTLLRKRSRAFARPRAA